MRLLTRKIYRAFPELDQFDDEACVRYIRRVWSQKNSWKFWLMLIALVPISWVLWFAIMIGSSEIFDLSVFPEMSDILTLMLTGFIWMPIIAGFLARDLWLYRQLRKQIDGAVCEDCGYCLVGLEIDKSEAIESVMCPECGDQNILDDQRLAREDIDPTLIASS